MTPGKIARPLSGPAWIDSLTHTELDLLAARLLKQWAHEAPLGNRRVLTHVAVRLEGYAQADKAAAA